MADIKAIVEEVKKLTVVELNELVKAFEEEFGVSAAAMAVAAPAAADAPKEEEKTEFDVVLKEIGGQKLAVIKAVKELTGVGLGEAKALVEGAPCTLKEAVAKATADEWIEKLKAAGAVAELK